MMLTRLMGVAAAAAVAALLAAPMAADARSPLEPAGKAPRKQCFYANNANGFAAPDEQNLYVRVGVRDVYHFSMFGRCPEIDWSQRVALVSRGSSWICDGMDADVITRSTLGPQRCAVRYVEKLTPEQVKALPKRAKP